jgi:UDP-GlcNAc:undecaprenyl-phosphate GlcNAc-1-phosphate transferase
MLAALAGSLVGFLRYNWHPAKIYMGDAGAMFIGLMLGALSMIGQYATQQDLALLSPVFILGVPIFDTLFVMYVRYRRGLPMFLGSPDHMPLRLRRWGLSVPQVVTVSYAASAVFGGLGILLIFAGRQAALAICVFSGAAALVAAYALLRVDTRTPLAVASDPATAVPATRKTRSA